MTFALRLGLRYLRSKKSSALSVITWVAVGGVALGVGALLAVLSITTGFQREFRDKVLGVNAHVLVLKYGIDFGEYREVVAQAKARPEVAGAAPFVIHEMMLSKGDRISSVLVKGIDPDAVGEVLDLPRYVVDGSLDGLRRPGAAPPIDPGQVLDEALDGDGEGTLGLDLDAFLQGLGDDGAAAAAPAEDGADAPLDEATLEALRDRVARAPDAPLVDEANRDVLPPEVAVALDEPPSAPGAAPAPLDDTPLEVDTLPEVDVPTPAEVEADLDAIFGEAELPDDAFERELFDEEQALLEGELGDPLEDLPGVVVGTTLAKNLGLGVGDRVKVISPLSGLDATYWGGAKTPRSLDFRVLAIFEAGFQEYDSRLVYVDVYEAQRFIDQGDVVNGVEITLHDLERAPEVAADLERTLGGGPFHTMDWRELNRNLFTALEIQKVMLTLVIATIVVVAAFNVVATLIMVVLEKKREIAILKAMGARDATILATFATQGIVIGLGGTAIGLLLGAGVVLYLARYEFPLDPKVYLIDHLPVVITPMEFVVTAAVALTICALATLAPSWWAARLLPADGVRWD